MAIDWNKGFLESLRADTAATPKMGFLEGLRSQHANLNLKLEMEGQLGEQTGQDVIDQLSGMKEGVKAPAQKAEAPTIPTADDSGMLDEVMSPEYTPIPEDFSPEESNLINYHRNTLDSGTELADDEGTTTIYMTGVQGPDGREYIIPGYFDGKRQDPEIAAVRAMLVGWDKYPSYASVDEAEKATQRLHQFIELDGETGQKANATSYKAPGIDFLEAEPVEESEVGTKEPMEKRAEQPSPPSGTRGIRNHNPGNIRHSSAKWMGQSADQPDKDFIKFNSPEMGVRALARVLRTYEEKHGLNTVAGIIARWAPPNENDTTAYVASVSRRIGVEPTAALNLNDYETVVPLVKAIIFHENGSQPYSDDAIMTGIKLSGIIEEDNNELGLRTQ